MNELYNKKTKSISYLINQYTNKVLLYKIVRHYFTKIILNKNYTLLSPCNDETLLFPDFAKLCKDIVYTYKYFSPSDVPVYFETYRSKSRQIHLFNAGSSKLRTYSMHHFGLAVDIVNYNKKRYEWNLNYNELRSYAKRANLTVLNWELCHFQYIQVSMQGVIIDVIEQATKIMQDLVNIKIDGIIGINTISHLGINIDRLNDYFDKHFPLIK